PEAANRIKNASRFRPNMRVSSRNVLRTASPKGPRPDTLFLGNAQIRKVERKAKRPTPCTRAGAASTRPNAARSKARGAAGALREGTAGATARAGPATLEA